MTNPRTIPAVREPLLTRDFWTLMTTASVFYLGLGGLNALLPRYVVDDLAGSELTAGIVMGSMAVSAIFSRVAIGRIGDRRGARRIMAGGALVCALALGLLALSDSVSGAIAARLVLGAGNAAMMIGSTMLSVELAPESRRSEATGYVLISFHVGMGIGPLAGEALLGTLSYEELFAVAACVMLAAAAIAMRLSHRPGHPPDEQAPWIQRNAIGPGVVTLFGVFSFNGFMMFAPLYSREVGLAGVGPVFLVSSITIVWVRIAFGSVPDRFGPVRAGSFALGLTAFAAFVVAGWNAPLGVFVGAALLASGLALQSPSFIAIAVDGVAPRERGAAMATYTTFFDVANALIGPIFGFLVGAFDYRAAFLTAGLLALVSLAILRFLVAPRHPGLR